MSQGSVNTVLLSPWLGAIYDLKQFTFEERKVNPQTVFVLYGERMIREEFLQEDRRFEHYFFIDPIWLEEDVSQAAGNCSTALKHRCAA
jgi:hypothetical protein